MITKDSLRIIGAGIIWAIFLACLGVSIYFCICVPWIFVFIHEFSRKLKEEQEKQQRQKEAERQKRIEELKDLMAGDIPEDSLTTQQQQLLRELKKELAELKQQQRIDALEQELQALKSGKSPDQRSAVKNSSASASMRRSISSRTVSGKRRAISAPSAPSLRR